MPNHLRKGFSPLRERRAASSGTWKIDQQPLLGNGGGLSISRQVAWRDRILAARCRICYTTATEQATGPKSYTKLRV